ncbi:D-2-hydroxyacid dehydrogenase [Sansalvadorimonas sp. 2012CJ34-2]|uniref:D-2-hydroxyacid dehydrogenase n=1 Tax=Parendozoicomonas callyspongiae TaxID=2942213 RepID=A0ABT0PER8_9GAMM|nr:D-2-hydroxyacid dehydrogenase [Sansalvadorimonas sp. 2012CJ34-2]MCL6269272.1 D-2-hydroxyacid dehydrogenase [Sansalvadorimonas sp. 2012CJ34-2]
MRAVLLDRATLGNDLDIFPLTSMDMEWDVYDRTPPDQVIERIRHAEVVLSNKVVISDAEMAAANQLRYIGVLATGTNNIDLQAASARSITVTNITAYGTASVAQHTFSLILSLATALPRYSQISQDGTWAKSDMFCLMDRPVMELAGKNLLIVGYGELGQAVARLGKAFGMNILIAKVPGSLSSATDRIELEDGLKLADVVSLHCPLTDQTRNLIGEPQLGLMKPHALLINTARGGLVDEASVVNALRQETIGGAGFDVLTQEPPVYGNPLLNTGLSNLIVTPHTAWLAKESRERLLLQAAENIKAFLNGNPANKVA